MEHAIIHLYNSVFRGKGVVVSPSPITTRLTVTYSSWEDCVLGGKCSFQQSHRKHGDGHDLPFIATENLTPSSFKAAATTSKKPNSAKLYNLGWISSRRV